MSLAFCHRPCPTTLAEPWSSTAVWWLQRAGGWGPAWSRRRPGSRRGWRGVKSVYMTKLTSLITFFKRSLTWGTSVFQSALELLTERRLSWRQSTFHPTAWAKAGVREGIQPWRARGGHLPHPRVGPRQGGSGTEGAPARGELRRIQDGCCRCPPCPGES